MTAFTRNSMFRRYLEGISGQTLGHYCFQIKNPGQKRMQVMKRTRRLRRPSPRTVTNRMVRAVLAAGGLLAAPSLCWHHGFAVCVHRGVDGPFFIFPYFPIKAV